MASLQQKKPILLVQEQMEGCTSVPKLKEVIAMKHLKSVIKQKKVTLKYLRMICMEMIIAVNNT